MECSKGYIEDIVSKKGLELVWVDDCIGTRRKNYLCLNKHLLKYPVFCNSVLVHELQHTSGYALKDLAIDSFQGSLFKTFSFCIKHPKAFWSFIPIDKFKGEWYIDISTILIYLFILLMLVVFISVR